MDTNKLMACYYAWGRFDGGQETLKTDPIEPRHIERFGELYADSHAALARHEVNGVPGLIRAWETFTDTNGLTITKRK